MVGKRGRSSAGKRITRLAMKLEYTLAELSQLASEFGNFLSGNCEFPRNSRSFSVQLRLVQTYPLPLQRVALVNWPLSKWARPFCKAIIGSKTARITATGASSKRCVLPKANG